MKGVTPTVDHDAIRRSLDKLGRLISVCQLVLTHDIPYTDGGYTKEVAIDLLDSMMVERDNIGQTLARPQLAARRAVDTGRR